MPVVALFFGIKIMIYFDDHDPPHFHAAYAEYEALFRIEDGEMIRGSLPRAQASIVRDWAKLRRAELMENWRHAQSDGHTFRIAGPDNR